MDKVVIDAKDCVVGRLATQVAKLAKIGKEVIIVNCEDAVLTGSRSTILKHYTTKLHRGSTEKGPFQPKRPDRLVRRVIRGMMEYKSASGKPAFRRITTFIGTPAEYKGLISKDFKCKTVSDLDKYKFARVSDICKQLGGTW